MIKKVFFCIKMVCLKHRLIKRCRDFIPSGKYIWIKNDFLVFNKEIKKVFLKTTTHKINNKRRNDLVLNGKIKIHFSNTKLNLIGDNIVVSLYLTKNYNFAKYKSNYEKLPYKKAKILRIIADKSIVVTEKVKSDIDSHNMDEAIEDIIISNLSKQSLGKERLLPNEVLNAFNIGEYFTTFQHGDLHYNNILFENQKDYKLIDFDCSDYFPFCYDYVMFKGVHNVGFEDKKLISLFKQFGIEYNHNEYLKYMSLCLLYRFYYKGYRLAGAYEFINFNNEVFPFIKEKELFKTIDYIEDFYSWELKKIESENKHGK